MGEIGLYPPGAPMASLLRYTPIIADTSALSDLATIPGLSATVTVPAGRTLRVTAHGQMHATAASGWLVTLKEDGTDVGRLWTATYAAAGYDSMDGSQILYPAAGAHTYTMVVDLFSGTGTIDVNALPAYPAYIMVEDITGTVWPSGSAVTGGMIASEAWTPYTPLWTASGTQPAIGNGTLVGRYMKMGRLVVGTIYFLMGSTTTYGTGSYFWSLPPVAAPYTGQSLWSVMGMMKAYQAGASLNAVTRVYNGTSTLQAVYSGTWPAGAETSVGQTAPWTWANGSTADLNFMYEAAA